MLGWVNTRFYLTCYNYIASLFCCLLEKLRRFLSVHVCRYVFMHWLEIMNKHPLNFLCTSDFLKLFLVFSRTFWIYCFVYWLRTSFHTSVHMVQICFIFLIKIFNNSLQVIYIEQSSQFEKVQKSI